ncbi:MAG: hypothetical protein LBC87_07370 [Fibromonadaceae bacterium]|jgi:hypothetical protein|nr:hypothetical protein [Fibromonadaceae bacterium]
MKRIKLIDVKEVYTKLIGKTLKSKDIAKQKAVFSRIFFALTLTSYEMQYRELNATMARFFGEAG